MTRRKILITGATGMMGSALARALAPDHAVYGVARFGDRAARDRLEQAGVRCVEHDLLEPDLSALPADVDTLLHFAVHWGSDAGSFNLNGFLIGRLLEHLSRLERFVIGSTVAVYVAGARTGLTENSPTIPAGVYGSSKLIGDAIATHVARQRDLPGAILRYWFPYGDDPAAPSDYYQGLVRRLCNGETFTVPEAGDDGGCQQPLFIDDLVRITLDSLDRTSPDPFVLNVAGPEQLSLERIVRTMADVFEIEPRLRRRPAAESDLLSGSYDLSKLERTCGAGKVTFREGMQRLRRRLAAAP